MAGSVNVISCTDGSSSGTRMVYEDGKPRNFHSMETEDNRSFRA